MQVRQVPLRHELGQSMPPDSSDISKGCCAQASKVWPSGRVCPVKNGRVEYKVIHLIVWSIKIGSSPCHTWVRGYLYNSVSLSLDVFKSVKNEFESFGFS